MELQYSSLLKSQVPFCGKWQSSASGQMMTVSNPATGEVFASVPEVSADEVRQAIEYAAIAMKDWQRVSASDRSRILRRWFDLIATHTDDLARILTFEQGKPLAEARGEIAYAASYVEWFAEESKRVYGDVIPAPSADRRLIVLKEPVGVCAAITPWNFPSAMITRKVAPALAAGCAMVVKPAAQTPLSALALAFLAEEAGLPPGLFSVVCGDAREIGAELCRHPAVRKMTFTGSTEVGKILLRQCADTVKKVTMELGGNAPFIVFEDADLDAAVEGCLISKFRNTGQTCVCANRIFVHESVQEAFCKKLSTALSRLVVGGGFDKGVSLGPLIDQAAVSKVQELVADALAQGAKLVCGGNMHKLGGNFYEPTVLTGCTHEMRLAQEEIFGPVAPIFSFRSDEEAVAMANDTSVGLASYFYSRDVGRIWKTASALECGMVGINTGLISNAMAPCGGIKESGIGREGSKYGIEEYLTTKYLCLAF